MTTETSATLRETAQALRDRGHHQLADMLDRAASDPVDEEFGPNRRTGYCPECGHKTHYTRVSGHQQHCGRCPWVGVPSYIPSEFSVRQKRHFALNGKEGINPLTI